MGRQFAGHIHKHLSRSARVRSLFDLYETVAPIQGEVPLHLLVRIKPDFLQSMLDSLVVCQIEQFSPVTFTLGLRCHSNAVNKQVICIYFQDSNSNRPAFDFQNPNLALFNAPPVILSGRFWDRSEHGHVSRNVRICAYSPNYLGVAEIGTSTYRQSRVHIDSHLISRDRISRKTAP